MGTSCSDGGAGDAVFSPDGSREISGDGAGGIAVWDAADGHTLQQLAAEAGTMTLGFFDPRGQVFSVDRAGRLRRWDSSGHAAGDPLPVHVATTKRYVWERPFTADTTAVTEEQFSEMQARSPDAELQAATRE